MLKSLGYIALTVGIIVLVIAVWLGLGMSTTPEQITVRENININ